MSNDILMIATSLDQPILSGEEDTWALNKVDEVLQEALVKKDLDIALDAVVGLTKIAKASGIALSKLFYNIKKHWHEFEVEEDFVDVIFTATGYHRTTVDRHVAIWTMYEEKLIPDSFQEKIQSRNVRDQIPIAKALQQGHEISNEQWEKLADAPDTVSVSRILREDVKGKEPRKGSLQLYLNRDGTITAYLDDVDFYVGTLEISNETVAVKKAIERIINSSGMLQQ